MHAHDQQPQADLISYSGLIKYVLYSHWFAKRTKFPLFKAEVSSRNEWELEEILFIKQEVIEKHGKYSLNQS
jgi:hypothetical protein